MTRFKVAGALLFCSILPAGPAAAVQTMTIDATRPGVVFASLGSADADNVIFQRAPLSPMERMAAHDYRRVIKKPEVAFAPAEDVPGSAWLIGAGFGTIFLIAARRRRPEIQGV